jgi:hypothetical protein
MMNILCWLLTFSISILNAWGCGRSWNETRANGGFVHLVNWSAAIMSAIGFTWCYTLIFGYLGVTIPVEHTVNGHLVTQPYLTADTYQAFLELNYMVLVIPLLGSGLIILINSWAKLWRERTFGNVAETAWNSYAMYSNVYDAFEVGGDVGGDWDVDEGGAIGLIVLIAILFALLGGCFTTYWILNSVRKDVGKLRNLQYNTR